MTTYKVEGTVLDGNTPLECSLRMYKRESGLLISTTTSDANGEYSFTGLTSTDEVQIVCLDPDAAPTRNDLVFRATPVVDPDGASSSLSNVITLDTLTLPTTLIWTNQYDWSSVVQDIQYSTSGAMFVQEAKKYGGRPITLETVDLVSYVDDYTRDALYTKQQTAGLEMELTINGDSYDVIFRQNENPLNIVKTADDSSTLYYLNSIKFMEIITT